MVFILFYIWRDLCAWFVFVLCQVPLEKYQVINQTPWQWVWYCRLQGHRVGLHKSVQVNKWLEWRGREWIQNGAEKEEQISRIPLSFFQSPWSAQLSSSQTPWAFNKNCGRPNFLCCPWFSRPQIIRWGAAQKDQCVIFIVSLRHFSVGVNFSILCFLWAFFQNWIYSIIPFSLLKKKIWNC